MGELAQHGRDKLTYVVSEPISSFGLWVEQLIAESTGKHGKGILPVADEPLGAPEVYGDDRVFAYLRNEDEPDAELDAQVEALGRAGHPTTTGRVIGGAADLGRIFFFTEFATAVAGWALGINPFDQPNVQEAKDNTARILEEGLPEVDPGSLDELLAGAAPPNYIAILGYVTPVGGVRRRRRRTCAWRCASARSARRRSGTARATSTRRGSTTRAARRTGCSSSSTSPRRRTSRFPRRATRSST